MNFEINIWALLKPIVRLSLLVLLIFSVGFIYAGGFRQDVLPGFIIISCIPAIPTIYLAIEYFVVSRKQNLVIKGSNLYVTKGQERKEYAINEISEVKVFKSAGMEKGSFTFSTPEMYYHAKLFMTDGQIIYLTSIMMPNVEDVLDMLKIQNKEVLRTIYSTLLW